ncbi:TolB amino-terminal domain-containing protein [Modicisalibacter muralis]|uniref:TolB amino-terminal domain-containing protein n=1 Tax=Modicisalibacter muralis TaxID=119000 RepID=A0A1G9GN50_9GAMM|nr:FlgO family outer membrane protein [Halomonas muralis]SDL02088.1 TolB amino-terminal domain-containing protein [Halomonas muralis]
MGVKPHARLLAAILCSMLFMLLASCATKDRGVVIVKSDNVDILKLVEKASIDLLENTHGLAPDRPLIAATFVSIDNLRKSSTFGRTLSEMFSSELVRAGLTVVEIKMRDSLFIQESTGELILSRDIRRLSASHDAQGILIGTYAQARDTAYINVRLVRSSDNVILGATNMQLPLDNNIRAMLPPTW